MKQAQSLPTRLRSALEALVGRLHNTELYAPVMKQQQESSFELEFTAILSEEFHDAVLEFMKSNLNIDLSGTCDSLYYKHRDCPNKVIHIYFGCDLRILRGRTRGFVIYDLGRVHVSKYDSTDESYLIDSLHQSLKTSCFYLNKIPKTLLMDI